MILVDIDGTIAATGEMLLSRYQVPLHHYPAPMPGNFWTSAEGLVIYRDVEPIPDSVQVLNNAEAVSYFTLRSPISGFITIRWLQKHGYPEGPVYFCKTLAEKAQLAKDLAPILVIEDDPKAPKLYKLPLVIVARPYNKHIKNRLTWKQIIGGSTCIKKPY
jgi:hypothetical protein